MKLSATPLSFLSLASAALGQVIQYPPLTGSYDVGTTAVELVDASRVDPLAPAGGPRDLMVSIFYPTNPANTTTGNCTRTPVFPPRTAGAVGSAFNLPNGTLASIYPNACRNAPLRTSRTNTTTFPLVMFSPGYGINRLAYTGIAELLASYGYVVATIDHPYTADIVEYPDGRAALLTNNNLTNEAELLSALETRRQDVNFVYSQFRNATTGSTGSTRNASSRRLLSAIRRAVDITSVGLFGHSFGGATSAAAMLNSTSYKCGANLDGPIFGPVAQAGLDRPFLMVAAADNNRTVYPGWTDFYSNLRGFKRDMTINGTTHGSFTDGPVIAELLLSSPAANGTLPTPESFQREFGTISGPRLSEVLNAHLDDFFGGCLKNRTPQLVLDQPSERYPEVTFEP